MSGSAGVSHMDVARGVLGLSSSATRAEIRPAYFSLVRRWHPDRQGDKGERFIKDCTEKFQQIQHAYEVLTEHAAQPANPGGGVPPGEAMSKVLRELFQKSFRKAGSKHRCVVHLSRDLAVPIGGFNVLTDVAGDGNCACYVLSIGLGTAYERSRLWPEECGLESFVEARDLAWWTSAGEAYRGGSNDGPIIIAAAAVLRSRIDERAGDCTSKWKFAHSLDAEDLGHLATDIIGCRIDIHARVGGRRAITCTSVGVLSGYTSVVNMYFTFGGGGHFQHLQRREKPEASPRPAQGDTPEHTCAGTPNDIFGTGGNDGDPVEQQAGQPDRGPGGSGFAPKSQPAGRRSQPSQGPCGSGGGCNEEPAPQPDAADRSFESSFIDIPSSPGSQSPLKRQRQGDNETIVQTQELDDDLGDYLLHENAFQTSAFADEDNFEWEDVEPVESKSSQHRSDLEAYCRRVLESAESVELSARNAVRAIVYISSIQELDTGVPSVARLLNFLELMRAHPDGLYTTGGMYEWDRCSCIPPDVDHQISAALNDAATYLNGCRNIVLSDEGIEELAKDIGSLGKGPSNYTCDRAIQRAAKADDASWGAVRATVALELRRKLAACPENVAKQYILWFQTQINATRGVFAFANGVARFTFGCSPQQVNISAEGNYYGSLPYSLKPKHDPEIASEVGKYLIGYYAGAKAAEMMERALECFAYLQVGHGLDKVLVIRDDGRKGKTARSVLRKTTFGSRSSHLGGSILTMDDEARKQLCRHMFVNVLDFDEFSTRDTLLRDILFALSGESPIFVRKPYGKDTDQVDWTWPSLLVILNLNCVPRLDTSRGDAAGKRFRVVERKDVRFTDVATEVDMENAVLPSISQIRKRLAEPAAGAFYMDCYLRKFIEKHSFEQALEYVSSPPPDVIRATAKFLEEAETGAPSIGAEEEKRVRSGG